MYGMSVKALEYSREYLTKRMRLGISVRKRMRGGLDGV
jgi:hypothetical protein